MQGSGSRRRYRFSFAAIATAVCLGLTSDTWAAEPGWQAPLDLSPGYLYTYPQLAPAEDGGFIHTWEPGDPSAKKSFRIAYVPHTGGPTSTQTMAGHPFLGVSLASDGNGNAIAAWDHRAANGCCKDLAISARAPGQNFGEIVTVAREDVFVARADAAMNRHGEAVVAYIAHYVDNTEELWAVFRSVGGQLSAPMRVSESIGVNFQDFQATISDNGEAVIAWVSPPEGVVRAAVGTAAGGFAAPQTLSDPTLTAFSASVAADAVGGAVVTWDHPSADGTGPNPVFAAVRRPGERFGGAVGLGEGSYLAWPHVAAGNAGRALVTFVDAEVQTNVVAVDTHTASMRTTRRFAAPSAVARVALSRSGEAAVVVETPIILGDGPIGGATFVAWGDENGTFGPLRSLTCPQPWYRLLDLVIGPNSDAGVMLLNHGNDIPGGSDDRTAIARSDKNLPPTMGGCVDQFPEHDVSEPGPLPPYGPQPVPALTPRLELQLPRRERLGPDRSFAVTVLSNVRGQLKLSGRVRVGKQRYELKPRRSQVTPVLNHRQMRISGEAMRALRAHKTGRGKAVIAATLNSGGQKTAAEGRLRLSR